MRPWGDWRAEPAQVHARWRPTGSSGKTTVKEMLASILRTQAGDAESVLATRGNLNNDLGVPLTLLQLAPQHRSAVIELGASRIGEIASRSS